MIWFFVLALVFFRAAAKRCSRDMLRSTSGNNVVVFIRKTGPLSRGIRRVRVPSGIGFTGARGSSCFVYCWWRFAHGGTRTPPPGQGVCVVCIAPVFRPQIRPLAMKKSMNCESYMCAAMFPTQFYFVVVDVPSVDSPRPTRGNVTVVRLRGGLLNAAHSLGSKTSFNITGTKY